MSGNKITQEKKRCFGNGEGKEFFAEYHDKEWGFPHHDDHKLFELLSLEGAQAGLSWETILKRRKHYQELFHHFDPVKVAKMTDTELEALCHNPLIIRNRLKIFSVRNNAQVFLSIQKEFGSFDKYIWQYVDNKPIVHRRAKLSDLPSKTELSDKISKDLKKRGMSFVGSTIMYAYMQAIGLVNDHLKDCWLNQ